MIFVTIGMTKPFDRLLAALAESPCEEQVVVQCGDWTGTLPAGWTAVSYLRFEELVSHVRAARAVVSHAGVGSILVAIAEHKRPVVVPRRAAFGEAVDDHQVELARRLAQLDLVALAEHPADVWPVLADATDVQPVQPPRGGTGLVDELTTYIAAQVAAA